MKGAAVPVRKRVLLALLGSCTVIVTGQVSLPSAEAAPPPYFPTQLAHVGNARQLVVVTSSSPSSSYATLRTYSKGSDGVWRQQFAPMLARAGSHGWSWGIRRVQGDRTSPIGTFTLTTAFGLRTNPGTHLAYLHADQDDYMAGDQRDPRTYNVLQTSASATRTWLANSNDSERIGAYPTQYQYGVVIDFNRPVASTITYSRVHSEYVTSRPANIRLGFAIYLHVRGGGSTAGCISLALADQVAVMRWLTPTMHPRIVMAPMVNIRQA